jgi:hypothetical protein
MGRDGKMGAIAPLQEVTMGKQMRKFILIWVLTIAAIAGLPSWQPVPQHLALAQSPRLVNVAEEVYRQLPDLPRANDYALLNGTPQPDNTLLYRLVYYHTRIKRRSPRYRLDWKLTLADYLGDNEDIIPDQYPGNTTLTENPLRGGRTALDRLNLRQRNALVNLLAAIHRPPSDRPAAPPPPQPQPAPPTPPTAPQPPALPQPGDSRLLL